MKSLSSFTKVYLFFIYTIGAFLFLRGFMVIRFTEPLLLIVLCVLGSILHILKVEGATNRSHYTFSFLIFGFAILHFGAPLAWIVILTSNLAEWVWNRPPWFIQLFNMSCYAIAAYVAGLVCTLINPSGNPTSWQIILAIGLGVASFTLVNHLIVGIVVWLARGENFKQSGIFDITPLLIDLIMLMVGASLAIVWNYNPYALLALLAPAYPLYMALKIPALERKTEIDQKTGLYNHPYFMTQLKNELQRANRYDRPISIIMADLDLLRNINNTYGHLAGDDVLKGVAGILKQTVRDYDIVARFGGEEFAILMPETEIEKAIQRAENLRTAIEAASFVIPTSVEPIKVTMSFGIAKRENFDQSMGEILHHADTALYRSKLSGRNTTLAYVNDSYLTASGTRTGLASEDRNANSSSFETADQRELTAEYSASSRAYLKRPVIANQQSNDEAETLPVTSNRAESSTKSFVSTMKVYCYITLLAVVAVGALIAARQVWIASISAYSIFEKMGFFAIAFIIIITEWFSINLYVRNTSVSTSAVPIITLAVLFGPLGTLVASTVLAITAALKFRSPLNRAIFNFSNHVIAGFLINAMVYSTNVNMGSWNNPLLELIIVLAATVIIFFCTTILISVGISIDQKQSSYAVWREQYRWMMASYLGIGFVSFVLLFGYVHAGVLGILAVFIPLALLRISQAQYIEHTRVVVNEIREKNQELGKRALEIDAMNDGLLTTLSEIIDLQDPEVFGHSKRVSEYATKIAERMSLNEKQIELIRRSGLLHDIGKLGISRDILTKPGKLTAHEYEIMKKHAALGAELVKSSPSLQTLSRIILHHHEHFDGRGYPDELSGNQICIEARIIAVADAIEVMSSNRPYRKALEPRAIIDELIRCSGTQFDPLVVTEAIKLVECFDPKGSTSRDHSPVETMMPQFQMNL